MSAPATTAPAAAHDVIEVRYRNAERRWVESRPETVAAIRRTLDRCEGEARAHPIVVTPGSPLPVAGTVALEGGGERRLGRRVPRDMELGYHRLHTDGGSEHRLIVSPGRCRLDDRVEGFGMAVQLYSARSRRSWGMGDLADLTTIGRWARAQGARFLLVNPLHAALPLAHQEACPYYPSSRQYRNPLYLRVEDVEGADRLGEHLDALAAAGHALNGSELIDRDAIWALKLRALEQIFAAAPPGPGFEAYVTRMGRSLEDYARFCVLTEHLGAGWRRWPEGYRNPRSAAVADFAGHHAGRVRFHMWLQHQLECQLRRAGEPVALMHDLAIGANPDGADCWMWGAAYATGFTVGAPPDRFNTQGQNWAQPPFNPLGLRANDYQPFIEMVRAAFTGGSALRFDHVMGLFRLWWIPEGAGAAEGAYVRYPSRDLLNILALESTRAGAFVVGEDLGTVAAGVRPALQHAGVLSYRLAIFTADLRSLPRDAMSAITTHDLPTVAGLWDGSDLDAQDRLRLHPNVRATTAMRASVGRLAGVPANAPAADVVTGLHRKLAACPSRLVATALEDLAVAPLRPNMPGTTAPTWPNWQIPLPQPLEELLADRGTQERIAALRR